MKKQRDVLSRLTEGVDLPEAPLPLQPLVELAGDRRVLIENHRGVTEYSREKIRVQVRFGQICICGEGLELAQMRKEQLVICGKIDSVSLIRRRM